MTIEEKLKKAKRVCSDCWKKYWERPENHIWSFHWNTCDVCWEEKLVTEPRDYWYFRKFLDTNKDND